jgi:hypothetical protein
MIKIAERRRRNHHDRGGRGLNYRDCTPFPGLFLNALRFWVAVIMGLRKTSGALFSALSKRAFAAFSLYFSGETFFMARRAQSPDYQ